MQCTSRARHLQKLFDAAYSHLRQNQMAHYVGKIKSLILGYVSKHDTHKSSVVIVRQHKFHNVQAIDRKNLSQLTISHSNSNFQDQKSIFPRPYHSQNDYMSPYESSLA